VFGSEAHYRSCLRCLSSERTFGLNLGVRPRSTLAQPFPIRRAVLVAYSGKSWLLLSDNLVLGVEDEERLPADRVSLHTARVCRCFEQ
jgi:hypothetical protein